MPSNAAENEAADAAAAVGALPIDIAQAARAFNVSLDSDYYADTISGAVVPTNASRAQVRQLAAKAAANLLDAEATD